MSRNAWRPQEPTGVLVITVWSEAGELRRVVSLTDPAPHPADSALELQRNYAPNDRAVLGLVRNWLQAVRKVTRRPVPYVVTPDPTIGPPDPTVTEANE